MHGPAAFLQAQALQPEEEPNLGSRSPLDHPKDVADFSSHAFLDARIRRRTFVHTYGRGSCGAQLFTSSGSACEFSTAGRSQPWQQRSQPTWHRRVQIRENWSIASFLCIGAHGISDAVAGMAPARSLVGLLCLTICLTVAHQVTACIFADKLNPQQLAGTQLFCSPLARSLLPRHSE